MPFVEFSVELPCPVEDLWAFHERPDAIRLLSPPFPPVRVVRDTGGLGVGSEKEFRILFAVCWIARHVECVPGRSFTDLQVAGPFRAWRHEHRMEPTTTGSRLVDRVEFEVAGGPAVEQMVRLALHGLFAYRHRATARGVRPGSD